MYFAYYFVLVEPIKEREFMNAIKEQKLNNIETYGKIIASCYGESPSDEVRHTLKEKYGFEV